MAAGRSVAELEAVLEDLVRRIRGLEGVVRIVLFGSAAQGRLGPESDLDLLVVVRDGLHRRRTAQRILRKLADLGIPKDVVVVTESDVRERAGDPSLVLFEALRDGKELYRAAG